MKEPRSSPPSQGGSAVGHCSLSGGAVAVVDAQQRLLMANPEFFGQLPAGKAAPGSPLAGLVPPAVWEVMLPGIEAALQGRETRTAIENGPDTAPCRQMLHCAPLCAGAEAGAGVLLQIEPSGRGRDTSQDDNENVYSNLFHRSHAAMLIVDPATGLIVDSNAAAQEFYGRDEDDLCLLPLAALEAPDSPMGALGPDVDHDAPFQARHLAREGKPCDVEVYVSPLVLEGRQLLHITIHDLSRYKQQEARNAFLASIVASTHDAVIGKSLQGVIRSWNRGAHNLYGYSEAEAVGKHVDMLVPPDLMDEFHGLMDRVCNGEKVDSHETRRLRKDGRAVWVSLILSPIRNDQGRIVGVSTIARDITAQMEARRRITFLASVVDRSADGIAVLDERGRLEYVNKAFRSLPGVSDSGLAGKSLHEVLPLADDAANGEATLRGLANADAWQGRLVLQSPAGARTILHARSFSLTPPGGAAVNRVCILRDLTREHALEAQLRHAQKMEALGTLASGIAHDFNNILASIMVNAETASLLGSQAKDMLQDCLGDISLSAQRGGELVRNILTYCRQSEQEFKILQLQPALKEAVRLIASTLPVDIRLSRDFQADTATVKADPAQLHQVLLNLAVNAVQAMPEGGDLRIGLHADERHAELQVCDTGCGIAPEHLQRVCDPFFTTKKAGEGTGLGLSIVEGIVTSHGGEMHIDSQPGQGTSVRILLPLDGSDHCEQPHSGEASPPGQGRLLLVDDDPSVLSSLRRGLTSLGYETRCTGNPLDALEILGANSFDLLLCDLKMPAMDGLELAHCARELHPGLPVVICSGDTTSCRPESLSALAPCDLLAKPVSIVDLNNVICRLIQAADS